MVWFVEIEVFLLIVLVYCYSGMLNFGDMIILVVWVFVGEIEVFDVLVGGMFCQVYFVVGFRKLLDDLCG